MRREGRAISAELSDCPNYQDDLAALALGTLAGRSRADVITHVESCHACELALAELSAASDRLLELAPSIEPPLGFERRVLERMHRARRPKRSLPRRRVVLVAVAAVALAVVGFVAGTLADGGTPQPARTATSALRAGGHTVGQLVIRPGSPARLVVKIDHLGRSGPVVCRVTKTDGSQLMLGIFWLYGGSGSWTVAIPFPASELRTATITTETGAKLASVTLS